MPESNSQPNCGYVGFSVNCELSYKDNAWKQFTTGNGKSSIMKNCELSYKDNAWKQFTTGLAAPKIDPILWIIL